MLVKLSNLKGLLLSIATVLATSAVAETQYDIDPYDPGIYSGHGSIYLKNFPADKMDYLVGTLGFIQSNNYSFLTSPRGLTIYPYNELVNRIFVFNYVPVKSGTIAYTNLMMDVDLHDQSPWNDRGVMAAVISHEVDHQRYGHHTCGSGDVDINSPTGVGILYGAKLYYYGNLQPYERSSVYWDSSARTSLYLCNNADSKAIGFSAVYNNVFPVAPVAPPAQPISPVRCTAKMIMLGICG